MLFHQPLVQNPCMYSFASKRKKFPYVLHINKIIHMTRKVYQLKTIGIRAALLIENKGAYLLTMHFSRNKSVTKTFQYSYQTSYFMTGKAY